MRDNLQPVGHDVGGVNSIASKEQRHSEDLTDTHKRSRVFTTHAITSENVENSVAARITMTSTFKSASGLQFNFTPSNNERL